MCVCVCLRVRLTSLPWCWGQVTNEAGVLPTRALFVMMKESCMQPGTDLHHEMATYNRQALAWFEQHISLTNDEQVPRGTRIPASGGPRR